MQTTSQITVLTNKSNIEGCTFVHNHIFRNGHEVPVYDIKTVSAFNQIIGFSKFVNSEYGNVYYRGVSGLYDNLLPSLMRKRAKGIPDDLTTLLKTITSNDFFIESLKLRKLFRPKTIWDRQELKLSERYNKYTVEALLQHYVGKTRFLAAFRKKC